MKEGKGLLRYIHSVKASMRRIPLHARITFILSSILPPIVTILCIELVKNRKLSILLIDEAWKAYFMVAVILGYSLGLPMAVIVMGILVIAAMVVVLSVLGFRVMSIDIISNLFMSIFLAALVGLLVDRIKFLEKERSKTIFFEERHRLGRDLHDTVAQVMATLHLKLDAALDMLTGGELAVGTSRLKESQKLVEMGLHELRMSIYDLQSEDFLNQNFTALLQGIADWAGEFYGLKVEIVNKSGMEFYPPVEVAINLHRIIQEALNNVYKHAETNEAKIIIDSSGNNVTVLVEDGGSGFDIGSQNQRGIGLDGMRARAKLMKASLDVASRPGQGSRVTIMMTMGVGWNEARFRR